MHLSSAYLAFLPNLLLISSLHPLRLERPRVLEKITFFTEITSARTSDAASRHGLTNLASQGRIPWRAPTHSPLPSCARIDGAVQQKACEGHGFTFGELKEAGISHKAGLLCALLFVLSVWLIKLKKNPQPNDLKAPYTCQTLPLPSSVSEQPHKITPHSIGAPMRTLPSPAHLCVICPDARTPVPHASAYHACPDVCLYHRSIRSL
jgi:hypothetical protein